MAASQAAQMEARPDAQGDEVAVTAQADGESGTGKSTKSRKASAPKEGKEKVVSARRAKPGDVGNILRGAYRQTVDEAIPDDLMDLLNKLE